MKNTSHTPASAFKLAGMHGHLKEVLEQWQLLKQVRRAIYDHRPIEQAITAEEKLFAFSIKINPRLQTCAGAVKFSQKTIELNKALLEAGHETERNDTLLHEIAHVLSAIIHNHKGHGKPWKDIMGQLNSNNEAAERCHNYSFLASKRHRPYSYTCMDCGTEITRMRKFHRAGLLRTWHHPSCRNKSHKGRFTFEDKRKSNT